MTRYTYGKIRSMVKELSLKKSGVRGIILYPQSEIEFQKLNLKSQKIPSKVPLKVKCALPDHPEWITTADRLQQGHWCKYCAYNIFTFDKAKKLVKELGLKKYGIEGRIIKPENSLEFKKLTRTYQPSYVPLLVSCGISNHQNWITSGKALSRGNWCRDCYIENMKLTFNDIKNIVKDAGLNKIGKKGTLLNPNNEEDFEKLTKNITPSKIPLKVKCGIRDHPEWITDASHLIRGNWCRFCVYNIYTYKSIKDLVREIGLKKFGVEGLLLKPRNKNEFKKLNKNFKPSEIPLLVKCGVLGHGSWITNAHRLQQGYWCSMCSQGEYEQICRWYFEQIFNKDFPKTQLSEVIRLDNEETLRETGLEALSNLIKYGHFDGYAELKLNGKSLKLAFEYNGPQHYRFPNHVHKTKEKFIYQQLLDQLKKKLCDLEENNTILITFPFCIDENMKNPEIIQNYIIKEFNMKTGISLTNLPKFNHKTFVFGQYRLDRFLK